MGTVTGLADYRADRETRRAEMAERAAMHPALRWVAGEVFYIAHRRNLDGVAVCGATGELTLAPPGVPQCARCYPKAADD
jgi:hypothetical protein